MQTANTLAQDMYENGDTLEEISSAQRALARGDGFEGGYPVEMFVYAPGAIALTGASFVSASTALGTLALGGTIGGGANVSYQISTNSESFSYTDASVATIVGALSQGKGFLATELLSVGGAYVGSQVKGTDPTGAMIGAGVGAAGGVVLGRSVSEHSKKLVPEAVGDVLGSVAGSAASESLGAGISEGLEARKKR